MKKFIVTISLLAFCTLLIAQFSAQHNDQNYVFNSQHFLSPQIHNPAFVGKRNLSNVGLRFKNYNNTANRNISYDFYLGNESETLKGALGFVASYFTDIGFSNLEPNTNIKLSAQYNYELEFLESAQFIFGVAPGVIHYLPSMTAEAQELITERFFKANLDVGFLVQNEVAYFSGAIHHMNKPQFTYTNIVRLQQDIYLNAGLDLVLADQVIFSPSAIFQNVNNYSVYQANLAFNIKDAVLLAASYRNEINTQNVTNPNNPDFEFPKRVNHNLQFTLGGFISDLQIATTYDLYLGDGVNVNYNKQFEVSLAYFFNRERKVSDF